jgi:hypothetical protein
MYVYYKGEIKYRAAAARDLKSINLGGRGGGAVRKTRAMQGIGFDRVTQSM